MSKILVTGATGFVGHHVARQLIEKEWGEVVCLVRAGSDRRFLSGLAVRFVEGDLRDRASLERALSGAEILFHVAADYRLWAKDPRELHRSNVEGTENILAAAGEAGAKKIVYTSSVSAVGRPEPAGAHPPLPASAAERPAWEKQFTGDETMDPTPAQLIGPYKRSKYQGELAARRSAQGGLPIVIVNPSTPVGDFDAKPTQTGRLVLDFLKGKMTGYLETGLNLVDVADVAAGHLLAAEKGKIGERYILGNRNLMLKEILETLADITGLPGPRFRVPYALAYAAGFFSTALAELSGRPPGIPLDGVRMAREVMFYDSTKAVRELGLPQSPVEGALRRAVDFFRNNGYI